MEKNRVHLSDWMGNALPDKSIPLIISDPPYFEVKGGFDFIWDSFEEYLKDVDKWAQECKRLLAENGTLIWWGHAKKIAYSQVILDKYFVLENHGVWKKKDCQSRRSSKEAMRSFMPVKEHWLMYSNYSKSENDWKNQNANLYFDGFDKIRLYLKNEISKVGVAKVAEHLNVSTRAIGHYTSKSQWYIPNEERYEKMQELGILRREYEEIRREYEEIRREYEEIRREYEEIRRYFNPISNHCEDVLEFSQEAHISKNYEHPTQKPESLTRVFIQTCSRPGDTVLVPFAGSGTECAMAAKEGRDFIGFDIDKEHQKMSQERADIYLARLELF